MVGAPPGAAVDLAARTLAQSLQARINQAVTVENLPGASGEFAATAVAAAEADGRKLLLASYRFDAVQPSKLLTLTAIAIVGSVPTVVVRETLIYPGSPGCSAGLHLAKILA
jgi:tripartite-type tricarboxylate transporter receptor subunit TctC